VKFIFAVLFVVVFAVSASSQEMTPLVPPAQTLYREKNDPKGDCRPLDSEHLDFNVTIGFPMTSGKVATEVVSSIRYDNLVFEYVDGGLVARLHYYLRFSAAKDRRIVGLVETDPRLTLTESQLRTDAKTQSFMIRHLVDLPQGDYIADIILRDIPSGCRGAKTIRFTIP
jgi:hypothetical protein